MRNCDNCTMCCMLPEIKELEKPAGIMCANCKNDCCSIYQDRPNECRNFQCTWLAGELRDEMKPSICGVMIERITPNIVIALSEEPNYDVPDEIINYYLDRDQSIAARGKRVYTPSGVNAEDVIRELITIYNSRSD